MGGINILWYKASSWMVGKLVNLFATQTNDDVENTIMILGSTRSGTTFLMESLNAKNEYRLIFEPFNPSYTEEWKGCSARQYMDRDTATSEMTQAVKKIMSGRVRNPWIDRYNRKIRASKRLIKCVRANLMLDYLEAEYPKVPIIYLYRDPYEVVASRIKLNFDAQDVFLILQQDVFLSKYYTSIDLSDLTARLDSPVKKHAALWCLENLFILRSLGKRCLLPVRFADIVGKTVRFREGSLRILDIKRRPSTTSSIIAQYSLSSQERGEIKQVLHYFGMSDEEYKNIMM